MVVGDAPENIHVWVEILGKEYQVVAAIIGYKALQRAERSSSRLSSPWHTVGTPSGSLQRDQCLF